MTRRFKTVLALAAATTLGLTSLMLGCLYLVRTQGVSGSLVGDQLYDWARAHEATLHVGAMRPTGLVGVRLEDVSVELSRGRARIRLETPKLDVRPSLTALASGRLAPGHLRIHGGEIVVSPHSPTPSVETENEPEVQDSAPSPPATSPDAPRPSPPPPTPTPLEIELHGVDLHAALDAMQTRPVHLRQATIGAELGPGNNAITTASGFGTFPGGVTFSISSTRVGGKSNHDRPVAFSIDASRPVALSALLGVRLPVGFLAGGGQVCPDCRTDKLCVDSPEVRRGRFQFPSSGACLDRTDNGWSIRLDEAGIFYRGESLPYRLTELRLDLVGGRHPLEFRAMVEGPNHDRLEVDVRVDASVPVVEVDLQSEGFQLGVFWLLAGVREHLRGGRVEGSLGIDLYPSSQVVAFDGAIDYRNITLAHDFINEQPLKLEASRLQLNAVTNLRLDHLSVTDTQLTLGDLEPLRIAGYVTRAHPGWAFEVDVGARNVDPGRLRDTLPRTLATPALGAKMKGTFDASLYSAGHTAYPESIRLEVGFDGDVDVIRESPNADVPTLAVNGPPTPYLPALKKVRLPLSQWVDLQTLDSEVPRVVLAAEDARFYEHPGFDWRGIRNAMVHNLKVGRFERGGSTITQQLAKNLFLTHDRTLARKLKELWIAWRLEEDLGKDRILELYLNIVQWGPGVHGLYEAADYYFDTKPEAMTIPQAILLGAILPGPTLYGPLLKKGYLPSSRLEKVKHILNNLRYFDIVDQKEYEEIYISAKWGFIGGYDVTICRDNDFAPVGAPDCPTP